MSFRQPTPTIIRSFHFREDAYEFLVESVLKPEQACDQLLIEASTGYLLTTLANTVPQTWQTLSYVTQPDGRSIARTTVTLLVSGSLLINGSVTLRDPLGEVVVLTITIDPLLFINSSILTFTRTEPDEDVFAILEISQRGAHTPVVLSTSDPNRFTLAENGEDLFSSVLTITPSFRGTGIRIRYAPDRPGRHTACLTAEAPYATKTVSLRGNAPGLLNWFRRPQSSTVRLPQETPIRQTATASARWLWFTAILLLGGLAYAGYVYQCKLIPGLCQPQTASKPVQIALKSAKTTPKPVIHSLDTALVTTRVSSAGIGNERLKNQLSTETRIEKKENGQVAKQRSLDSLQRIVNVTASGPLRPGYQTKRYNRKQLKRYWRQPKRNWRQPRRNWRQPKRRVRSPVSLDESKRESDLEKELNRRVTNRQ